MEDVRTVGFKAVAFHYPHVDVQPIAMAMINFMFETTTTV